MTDDELDRALAKIRGGGTAAAGAADPDAALAQLRKQKPNVRRALGLRDTARADATATQDPRRALRPREEKIVGTEAQQTLGGIAALARDIPGAEALQAGSRALVRTGLNKALRGRVPDRFVPDAESYGEAREQIRSGEASAPAPVRALNRFTGGTIAALVAPGSTGAQQGASYGVAKALGNSNPDAGVKDRVIDATVEGTLGAAGGKLGEAVGTSVKALRTQPLGAAALARTKALREGSGHLYDTAEIEGIINGSTSPEIKAALAAKDIAPIVDDLRASREFATADDATLLRAAYKHMSERQGLLRGRTSPDNYRAGTDLEQREIRAAKEELLNAADPVMPTFRKAVGTHAKLAGEREAFQAGAGDAQRVLGGRQPTPKKLGTQSPQAIQQSIDKLPPERADAYGEGQLGTLRNRLGLRLSPNPLTGFGLTTGFGAGPSLMRAGQLAPFVNAVEARGAAPGSILAGALEGSGYGMTRPLNAVRGLATDAMTPDELAEALRRIRP